MKHVKKLKAYDYVDKPTDKTFVDTKWVLKTKEGEAENAVRFKAR